MKLGIVGLPNVGKSTLFLKYEPISGREGRRMLWNATTRAIRLMWRS